MAAFQNIPINELTQEQINTDECQICFEQLYNITPDLSPSEITTCHHRFHRDCLRHQWCNNNAGNTLAACRCPTCNQTFNCNTQLLDLTQQVTARIQQLQAPVVEVVEPVINLPINNVPINNVPIANLVDIVGSDPDIIRICGDLSLFLNPIINSSFLIDMAQSISHTNSQMQNNPHMRAQNPAPDLAVNGFPRRGESYFTPNTFIILVKYFVRVYNGIDRQRRVQEAITALQNILDNILSPRNINETRERDRRSRGDGGFMPFDANQEMTRLFNSIKIPGILYLTAIYSILLKSVGQNVNVLRQYISLILQLYIRIQQLIPAQGGKIKTKRRKGKRKSNKTKKLKNKIKRRRSRKNN
jgi:hypothetical protein